MITAILTVVFILLFVILVFLTVVIIKTFATLGKVDVVTMAINMDAYQAEDLIKATEQQLDRIIAGERVVFPGGKYEVRRTEKGSFCYFDKVEPTNDEPLNHDFRHPV